ncbi:hypothetical protein ACFQJC_02810 [Haloferax namakaokahaiae]|uniref:Uncharacterized protein n=1 Tax=Haloferax namakaokahaiae TaxID=1748331 RepID=A0ABD5ZBF1_9EURY
MRYRLAVVLAVLLGVSLLTSAALTPNTTAHDGPPTDDRLVQPTEGTYVWPYTSKSQSIDKRTLALTVIVHGDTERTKRLLTDPSSLNWSTAEGDDPVFDTSPWHPARGATRYTYLMSERDDRGKWVHSEYQLQDGTYLGTRTHLRAYPSPSGNWTAFQPHVEYWDWYRLRHTVTGVAPAARQLENDLRRQPVVSDVDRVYHGHRGGGSDGWTTVVGLAPAALVIAAAAPVVSRTQWETEQTDFVAFPLTLVALVLGVRVAGVAAEGLFPGVTPKLFAGLLYPVLVVGPLLLARHFARDMPANLAPLLAIVGLGAAFVLDMNALGVSKVSVDLVIHRAALASSLGAFAYGVALDDRRQKNAALVAWVMTLAASLFGFV